MADSDDLINQAIAARQNIEAQRLTLISRLRSTPSGRRGSRAAMAIQDEIHGLDRQASEMDREIALEHHELDRRHSEELRNTAEAHKLAEKQQQVETTRQAGEVFLKGQEIFNKYKLGDPRINEEMGKLREQFPLGFDTMAVKGHFGKLAASHDQEVDRVQKLAANELAKAGLTPSEFALRTLTRRGKVDEATGQFTNQYTGAEKGNTMAFDIGGKTYHTSVADFNRFDKVFGRPESAIKESQPAQISPDEQAQSAGFRSAQQAIGYSQGKPMLDFAPPGTVSTEKRPPTESGVLPSGGYFSSTPLPRSTVPQTPEASREEIQRQTEAQNQGIQSGVQPSVQPAVQPTAQPQPTAVSGRMVTTNPIIDAPRNSQERVFGQIYSTPKGNLRWNGTEWVNP